MYKIWYWAMIDRESNGRFIASIPDLGDLAAYGENDERCGGLTDLGRKRYRELPNAAPSHVDAVLMRHLLHGRHH
jgi:hypothetical protein